jgi:hypothetical protein
MITKPPRMLIHATSPRVITELYRKYKSAAELNLHCSQLSGTPYTISVLCDAWRRVIVVKRHLVARTAGCCCPALTVVTQWEGTLAINLRQVQQQIFWIWWTVLLFRLSRDAAAAAPRATAYAREGRPPLLPRKQAVGEHRSERGLLCFASTHVSTAVSQI